MNTKSAQSRIGEIIAEMSAITEFAKGSIISSCSYYMTKNGTRRKTKPQYKFQSRGGRGKQRLHHIPISLVPKVRKLIENGRKLEKLQSEYEQIVTETSLAALKNAAAEG